ncbi:hypothetical protein [Natrinema sp. DC36]|uniref:hypothetical protein n=1 Tax=Natrinema sp. DC36 TaxID=2878680 RepID=UPI001CEFF0EE|nr:hypothetical protein [Natrinema sp. DC36]
MTLTIPAEDGEHSIEDYDVTVELDYQYELGGGGYDAAKVSTRGGVDIYLDEDGDYWISKSHCSEDAILPLTNGEFADVLAEFDAEEDIEVPEEEGTYYRQGREITVEETEPEYETELRGYPATLIWEDNPIEVYEDSDGDYWIKQYHRDDDCATLIMESNPIYDAINDVVTESEEDGVTADGCSGSDGLFA